MDATGCLGAAATCLPAPGVPAVNYRGGSDGAAEHKDAP